VRPFGLGPFLACVSPFVCCACLLVAVVIAMMELHWNKEAKIAMNVFEHGLKAFGDDIDYVVRYLDFLIITNDDASQCPLSCLTSSALCLRARCY
jgi:Suppressor of forked protein (Suf)